LRKDVKVEVHKEDQTLFMQMVKTVKIISDLIAFS
jgi:hypothetical protein